MVSGGDDGRGDVGAAIADIRDGRFVVVTDGTGALLEGDLVMAAELASADAVAFMARNCRGVIHVCLPEPRCRELELAPIAPHFNPERWTTAMTVSIEARTGVSTGISAADRARTLRVAADPSSTAHDLVRPGHIFPLAARPGGVLERRGRTEAAVDLPRLAGLSPAGVDCEILTVDGDRARGEAIFDFCRAHEIRHVGVEDLVFHRVRAAPVLEPIASTAGGTFRVTAFRERISGTIHLGVVGHGARRAEGRWSVHRHCTASSLLGRAACDCARRVSDAVEQAQESGGVAVIDVDFAALDGRPLTCVLDREDTAIDRARRDAVVSQIRRNRVDLPPR
jgi:3,4-dihydroxy 2-butanone 4-phosphate synthase/GTP cyclohydrolase II